jgi:hypothetical protein
MSAFEAPLVFLLAGLLFGLASVVFLIVDALFASALSALYLPRDSDVAPPSYFEARRMLIDLVEGRRTKK